jgi:hypothetical protein
MTTAPDKMHAGEHYAEARRLLAIAAELDPPTRNQDKIPDAAMSDHVANLLRMADLHLRLSQDYRTPPPPESALDVNEAGGHGRPW